MNHEIDRFYKTGHPLIRGNNLDRSKPDLLIHQPGDMGGNLVAIEVKPINASSTAVAQDLVKLTAFRRHAGYRAAFLLFYGNSPLEPARPEVDISLIEVFLHRSPGKPPEHVIPA